jgi:hypothetical protein
MVSSPSPISSMKHAVPQRMKMDIRGRSFSDPFSTVALNRLDRQDPNDEGDERLGTAP